MKEQAKEWAPKDLIALYNGVDPPECRGFSPRLGRGLRDNDLLKKFVTDENMQSVWKALRKRTMSIATAGADKFYGAHLLSVCQVFDAEWHARPNETSAERKATLRRIAKTSSDLKKLMDDSGHFPAFSIEQLLNDPELDTSALAITLMPIRSVVGDDLKEWNADTRRIWLRSMLSASLPSYTQMLSRLSELASKMANRKVQYSAQAHAKHARANSFAIRLSDYIRRTYKNPFHEQVAVITNLVTGGDLDRNSVRALVSYSETSAAAKTKKVLRD